MLIESSSMACWTSTLMILGRCRSCLMGLLMQDKICAACVYADCEVLLQYQQHISIY